jgi:hypothetical protein
VQYFTTPGYYNTCIREVQRIPLPNVGAAPVAEVVCIVPIGFGILNIQAS